MRTEIALGRGVVVGIDIERIVGAGLHAAFATDTAAIVEIYDSIRTAEERVRGANFDAGRVVAVVTSHHAEVSPGLGELAGLHVFHPGSEDSDGDLVFFLAGNRTGVAADTSILVDNEPVAHKKNGNCTYITTKRTTDGTDLSSGRGSVHGFSWQAQFPALNTSCSGTSVTAGTPRCDGRKARNARSILTRLCVPDHAIT
jgi:hypothetical protein